MIYIYCKSIKILSFILLYILCAECVGAQLITTYAGSGALTAFGDGGPATAAGLGGPLFYCYLTKTNDLYIASLDVIRKVDAAGIITTFAGNYMGGYTGDGVPASATKLNQVFGVVADKNGNVFISDSWNFRIRKVNTAGMISTIAGTGVSGYSGDGGQATNAKLDTTWGITLDRHGNLYIAEQGCKCIRKIDTTGIITTVVGSGVGGYNGDSIPATAAQLNQPEDVAVDTYGNIYIADAGNCRIRKVDASGIITTIAGTGVWGYGGDGGPATAASIRAPKVTTDTLGNIYLGDANRIRKIDPSGIITTIIGTGISGYNGDGCIATAAEITAGSKVTIDTNGFIYLADWVNGRIRKIYPDKPPHITGGHSQSFSVCKNSGAVSLDTLLAITDTDLAQSEIWSPVYAPTHGTAVLNDSSESTGGVKYPSGLSYTPATGYTGLDSFKVLITDCSYLTDSVTIYVTVDPGVPAVSPISGLDTVCYHKTITLTDTASGGSWFATNANAIVTAGIVQGEHAGLDTISYLVANSCGSAKVSLPIYVKDCTAGLSSLAANEEITIYPNPTTGAFTLTFPPGISEQATITITNMLGQKVKEMSANSLSPIELHLNTPPGIYLLTTVSAHILWSNKVIIR